jgi:hypothetical protein
MAQVTNQQLQTMLLTLSGRVDRIEERMRTYEDEAKEHTVILKRIETTVNSYEQAIRTLAALLKWVLGIIAVAGASVLAYWVMGLLHLRLP